MEEPRTLIIGRTDVSLFQGLESPGHPPCLVVYNGSDTGQRFEVGQGRSVIGRHAGAEIFIDSPGISRRHAQLEVAHDGVVFHDLGSANGSFVNERRVDHAVTLADGQLLRLGNVVLKFFASGSLDSLLHDRIIRLAAVDAGTGVFNRRFVLDALKRGAMRSAASGQPLAVLALDLDHIKSVNDRYGHPAGDEVLRGVADVLRAMLPAVDTVGRLGGEEFVVVMPRSDAADAAAMAERVRVAVAALTFRLKPLATPGGAPVIHRQTVSIGVAALGRGGGDTEALMAAADRALYAAKHAGRDCVRVDGGG